MPNIKTEYFADGTQVKTDLSMACPKHQRWLEAVADWKSFAASHPSELPGLLSQMTDRGTFKYVTSNNSEVHVGITTKKSGDVNWNDTTHKTTDVEIASGHYLTPAGDSLKSCRNRCDPCTVRCTFLPQVKDKQIRWHMQWGGKVLEGGPEALIKDSGTIISSTRQES